MRLAELPVRRIRMMPLRPKVGHIWTKQPPRVKRLIPMTQFDSVKVEHTDFAEVVREIKRRAGFGNPAIARILGCGHERVRNWLRGCEPRYDDGEALLKILAVCRANG